MEIQGGGVKGTSEQLKNSCSSNHSQLFKGKLATEKRICCLISNTSVLETHFPHSSPCPALFLLCAGLFHPSLSTPPFLCLSLSLRFTGTDRAVM